MPLGFSKHTSEDGKLTYGCRGMGERYENFYKWTLGRSYVCVFEDWPWDYFRFTEPKDEEEFLSVWATDIDDLDLIED